MGTRLLRTTQESRWKLAAVVGCLILAVTALVGCAGDSTVGTAEVGETSEGVTIDAPTTPIAGEASGSDYPIYHESVPIGIRSEEPIAVMVEHFDDLLETTSRYDACYSVDATTHFEYVDFKEVREGFAAEGLTGDELTGAILRVASPSRVAARIDALEDYFSANCLGGVLEVPTEDPMALGPDYPLIFKGPTDQIEGFYGGKWSLGSERACFSANATLKQEVEAVAVQNIDYLEEKDLNARIQNLESFMDIFCGSIAWQDVQWQPHSG